MQIWILTVGFILIAAPVFAVECNDGVDNDGDTLIDYPNDPGCYGRRDRDEYNQTECNDGITNDTDGLIDLEDPGCESLADNSETSSLLICDDGLDNDGDGLADLDDPGCSDSWDPVENCGGEPDCPECDDGINNELPGYLHDDLIDADDIQCWGPEDISEYCDCWDGRDNNGDGKIDTCKAWNLDTCDPACGGESCLFDEEGGGPGSGSGGGGGIVACGIGFELAFLLPLLMGLRHIRKRQAAIAATALLFFVALTVLAGCAPSGVGIRQASAINHLVTAPAYATHRDGSFDNPYWRAVAYPVVMPGHILAGAAEFWIVPGCEFFAPSHCIPWESDPPYRITIDSWTWGMVE
jgi:hypothetical protein